MCGNFNHARTRAAADGIIYADNSIIAAAQRHYTRAAANTPGGKIMHKAIKPAALTLAAFAAGIGIGLSADVRANGGGDAPAMRQANPKTVVTACVVEPNPDGGWTAWRVNADDSVNADTWGYGWPLSAYLAHNPMCAAEPRALLRWAKQQDDPAPAVR